MNLKAMIFFDFGNNSCGEKMAKRKPEKKIMYKKIGREKQKYKKKKKYNYFRFEVNDEQNQLLSRQILVECSTFHHFLSYNPKMLEMEIDILF